MRLRYWIKSGLQTFGLVVLACGLFSFLMFLQLDDGDGSILVLTPLYLLLFGGMMLITMSVGVYKFNLQLALSFGSTRNEALVGLNLFRLIPTVLLTVLLTVLCSLSIAADTLQVGEAIPLGLGVYLLCSAIGTVIGMIYTRFGKIATVISTVMILLISIGCGLLAGFSASDSFLAMIATEGKIHWLFLCIGLLVYCIASIPEQRTVWKCNVKL